MSKREREPTTPSSSVTVRSSNAPSAHAIGICAMAMREKEDRMVFAREDGSLAVTKMRPSKRYNNVSLTPAVRTGSFEGRTVTRLLYALNDSVIIASYLSGQIVVYDEATLTPLHVAERVGGAIWDMAVVPRGASSTTAAAASAAITGDAVANPSTATPASASSSSASAVSENEEEIVCACADGSWYHFTLVRIPAAKGSKAASPTASPTYQLNLMQVYPKVVGAHRALAVAVCDNMIVGSDDCGNIVAWEKLGKGVRGYNQLWLARLPKGGYAKTITYDKETNYVVVGTSLGDVAFLSGSKGTIVNLYTNHHGPITCVAPAGPRTILATGWHESLRAYRFVEGKWIPSEVRRRTHYHEATQLLYVKSSHCVVGASRDGTIIIASMADSFASAPKYSQPVPQLYAYASGAGVLLTVCGSRVEMYQQNEAKSHWTPLAVYTAHGNLGISGVWCDAALSRIVVATTTRLIVLGCTRKSTAAISLTKITDKPYANVHAVVLDSAADCYIIHGIGRLTHLAFGPGANPTSVIESHITLPTKATSIGKMFGTVYEGDEAPPSVHLVAASFVDSEDVPLRIPLNLDGSFASTTPEPVPNLRADYIYSNTALGIASYKNNFIDLTDKNLNPFAMTMPPDTIFIAKLSSGVLRKRKEIVATDDTAAAVGFGSEEAETKRALTEEKKNKKSDEDGEEEEEGFDPYAVNNGRSMWMGYCPRGLMLITRKAWWLADEDFRAVREANRKKVSNAEELDRSVAVALTGPRTRYAAGFDSGNPLEVIVLARDIEAEVESLPLMWKVRRFGN